MSLIVFAMPFSCGVSNHLCRKNLQGLKAIRLIDHKGLRGIGRGTITYCLCYSNGSIQACTNPLASSTWRRESLKLIHHQKFSFTKLWLLATQFEIRQLNLKAALQILRNAIGKTPKDKARWWYPWPLPRQLIRPCCTLAFLPRLKSTVTRNLLLARRIDLCVSNFVQMIQTFC